MYVTLSWPSNDLYNHNLMWKECYWQTLQVIIAIPHDELHLITVCYSFGPWYIFVILKYQCLSFHYLYYLSSVWSMNVGGLNFLSQHFSKFHDLIVCVKSPITALKLKSILCLSVCYVHLIHVTYISYMLRTSHTTCFIFIWYMYTVLCIIQLSLLTPIKRNRPQTVLFSLINGLKGHVGEPIVISPVELHYA